MQFHHFIIHRLLSIKKCRANSLFFCFFLGKTEKNIQRVGKQRRCHCNPSARGAGGGGGGERLEKGARKGVCFIDGSHTIETEVKDKVDHTTTRMPGPL
jgi:hypothetical protein